MPNAKGSENAFKASLAKFVLADCAHFVAVKSEEGALRSLSTLHYGGDIFHPRS